MFRNFCQNKKKLKLKNRNFITKKMYLNIINRILWKFETIISKNLEQDRSFYEIAFFAVLVSISYKEPIIGFNFDLLLNKN